MPAINASENTTNGGEGEAKEVMKNSSHGRYLRMARRASDGGPRRSFFRSWGSAFLQKSLHHKSLPLVKIQYRVSRHRRR